MGKFKSHWFYWHTGHKFIAVTSMFVSTMGMWLILAVTAGFSVWSIIIAVLLDGIGFWLLIIYFLVLRDYVPEFMSLQEKVDSLVVYKFIIPILISFFVSRMSAFFVAKKFGHPFQDVSE